ncbi:hypothetical protein DF153_02470 [Burkholderia cenocepacia]|nr:hypothetical protein DF152_07000 [Burkholderia cenocepacia]RQU28002.1 hypothetical protein DF153_02470 [Burkholderia cenocepacia]
MLVEVAAQRARAHRERVEVEGVVHVPFSVFDGRADGRAQGADPVKTEAKKTKSPLCVGISGLRCSTTAIDSGRLPPAFALAVLGSCPASAS